MQQLIILAHALADEIDTLKAELSNDWAPTKVKQIDFDKGGIDFYNEIERYEIESISSALNQCGGNQTYAEHRSCESFTRTSISCAGEPPAVPVKRLFDFADSGEEGEGGAADE